MNRALRLALLLLVGLLVLAACGGAAPVPERSPAALKGTFIDTGRFGTIAHPTIGETFRTTNGTWKNAPTSFAYQWERCNASGTSCSNISGAQAQTYTVVEADVGHTLRSAVTATNVHGSTTATSAATGIVEREGEGGSEITCTAGPYATSEWSNVQKAAETAGATVCLAEGSWAAQSIGAVAPSSLSTITAAPNAHVKMAGLTLGNASAKNLAFENIVFTGTVNINKGSYFTIAHDEWPRSENSGVVVYGTTAGTKVNHVTIEYDKIEELDGKPGGVGNAQCDTNIGEWEYVTFSNSQCGPKLSGHFVQDGGGNHLTIEHDTFLGPSYRYEWKTKEKSPEGYHTNVLQVFHPSEYVTFAHNVSRNLGTNGNAILVEGTGETEPLYNHITIEDNLFERSEDGQGPGFCPQENFTYAWNTNIYSSPESANFAVTAFSARTTPVSNSDCKEGANDKVEHNIMVEVPCAKSVPGFQTGGSETESKVEPCPTHHNTDLSWNSGAGTGKFCASSCTVEYNVTEDTSANSASSAHYVTGYKPAGGKTSEWTTLFKSVTEGTYGLESEKWEPAESEFTSTSGGAKFKAGYKGDGGAPANIGPDNFYSPTAPKNTAVPVISASEGYYAEKSASTTNGTWTGSPESFSYQWRKCNSSGESCSNITGATSSSFTLEAADVGGTVKVEVTATNKHGSATATSAATEVIKEAEGAVEPLVGETTELKSAHVEQNQGAILAWPFVAKKTGTAQVLHLLVGSTSHSESVEFGVYENATYSLNEPFEVFTCSGCKARKSAFFKTACEKGELRECNKTTVEGEGPGKLLEARSFSPKQPGSSYAWEEFTGFSVKITAGHKYWLAVLQHGEGGANGKLLFYGKKESVEWGGFSAEGGWANYSNESEGNSRKITEIPAPPTAKYMKQSTKGWQQEEVNKTRDQTNSNEAQEEGGPASIYMSGPT